MLKAGIEVPDSVGVAILDFTTAILDTGDHAYLRDAEDMKASTSQIRTPRDTLSHQPMI